MEDNIDKLDKLESVFRFAKLPKTKDVLSVFLSNLSESQGSEVEAADVTVIHLKEVWQHHFGMRVIMGYDTAMEQETKKMISLDMKYQQEGLEDLEGLEGDGEG